MNDSRSEQSTALRLGGSKSIAEIDVSPLVDLEDLRQGLKSLEHAVITNRLALIQPSTSHVTYCVRTLLQTTDFLQQKSNTAILQRFVKLAGQRQRILVVLETLVIQSQNVLKENILEDEQELETVNLLGSSEQILSLVQEFIYTADEYGIHATIKSSSRQTDSINHDDKVSPILPGSLASNISEHTITSTRTTSATLSLFRLEHVEFSLDGTLLGATICALVEEMTPHDTIVDQAFSSAFFLTFRLFSSPAELLENAISRWNLKPPSNISEERLHTWERRKRIPVRLRVLNLIKTWILHHWESGTDDSVLPALETFLREEAGILDSDTSKRISVDLLHIVAKRMKSSDGISGKRARGFSEPKMSAIPPLIKTPIRRASINFQNFQVFQIPAPIISRALMTYLLKKDFGDISITSFDPLELARQITIMESNLFCALLPSEMTRADQESEESAKNMMAVMSLSTAITKWVSESILKEPDNKKLKRLTKFFIQLANCCVDLNNFASLRSILTALNSLDLVRSQVMRSGLSQKQKEQFDNLNLLADHQYRNRLDLTTPPAIPILSLHISDLISCRHSIPSYINSTYNPSIAFINFTKYREIAKTVQSMLALQVTYNLKSVPEIQEYLHHSIFTSKNTEKNVFNERLLPRNDADNQIAAQSSSSSKSQIDPDPEDMSMVGVNPTDISIYSIPSSRTASTDYGLFYTRHACSQDSFGYQWWADSPDANPPPINV